MLGGVHDGEDAIAVFGRVPAAAGRLVRAGRTPEELAREFEPSAQAIRNWVQAGRARRRTSHGRPDDRRARGAGAPAARECAAAGRARDPDKSRGLVRAGDREESERIFEFVSAHQADVLDPRDVPSAGRLRQRVLRVAAADDLGASERGRGAAAKDRSDPSPVAPDVRRAAHPCRAAGRRNPSRSQAGRAADAARAWRASAGGSRAVTTRRDRSARPAPDLVERQFAADRAEQLWVADITYIPTWAGFLYLAVVLDVWSRRIVGWAMATHLRTALVLGALDMAIAQRRPRGVIHHSDQGCQYTSIAFGQRCREAGVRPSMGSVGDCYDNAMCESFFATLECELLDRSTFRTTPRPRCDLRLHRGLLQHAPTALGARLPFTRAVREASGSRRLTQYQPVHETGVSPYCHVDRDRPNSLQPRRSLTPYRSIAYAASRRHAAGVTTFLS